MSGKSRLCVAGAALTSLYAARKLLRVERTDDGVLVAPSNELWSARVYITERKDDMAQKKYPYKDGPVTVLGPGVTLDESEEVVHVASLGKDFFTSQDSQKGNDDDHINEPLLHQAAQRLARKQLVVSTRQQDTLGVLDSLGIDVSVQDVVPMSVLGIRRKDHACVVTVYDAASDFVFTVRSDGALRDIEDDAAADEGTHEKGELRDDDADEEID